MDVIKSMKDLEKVPKNGYKMVSSFSGCGGSCLGFKAAGYEVLSAIEFIPEAARTYKSNFPDTFVYEADIRDIHGKDILKRFGLEVGELDVFEGSPPCSDFSTQRISTTGLERGKYKHYSQTKQRVDDLFLEYTRLLGELSPKVFVAENVSTLVGLEDYFQAFLDAMRGANLAGYDVGYRVYDFANLGVPQSRKRVIIQGVRKDLGLKPVFPEDNHKIVTTGEVIGDLIDSQPDLKMTELEQKYCRIIPVGAGSAFLTELRQKYKLKIMTFNHRRDTWDIPHPTLVHNTRHIHPMRNRWLTVQEGKRICSFPDDFILTGTSAQQWERLGRAVPPQAYYCIAECIRDNVLNKI